MNTNLKPCARCGSTRVDLVPICPDAPNREAQCWEPFCYDCDTAKYLDSEQTRIDAWNNRPIEDELRAKVRELEMLLEGSNQTHNRIAEIVGDRGQYRDLEEALMLHIADLKARALHAESAYLKANAKVVELEGMNCELNKSLHTYQMEWATHTARIKELEEAMPSYNELHYIGMGLRMFSNTGPSTELLAMSERIEKVMKKEKIDAPQPSAD